MPIKNIFILIYLILFSSIAQAQSVATDLTALLNATKSMRADFVQTIYDEQGKTIQQSYGQMAISRPGKFRWQVMKPIPQLIIANDARLWIYDPDLEQVTIRSLKNMSGEAPALLLSQVDATLEKDYAVKILQKKPTTMRWFLLTPKTTDHMFSTIQLGFTDGRITDMRLQDNLGHMTAIRFKNIALNPTLSASLFNFKIPANIDVIDETRGR